MDRKELFSLIGVDIIRYQEIEKMFQSLAKKAEKVLDDHLFAQKVDSILIGKIRGFPHCSASPQAIRFVENFAKEHNYTLEELSHLYKFYDTTSELLSIEEDYDED